VYWYTVYQPIVQCSENGAVQHRRAGRRSRAKKHAFFLPGTKKHAFFPVLQANSSEKKSMLFSTSKKACFFI
jgi:hypothetical protein